MKKLYFTDDFSPENVEELQSQGYILRKSGSYHDGDYIEDFDEVAGDYPEAYDKKESSDKPVDKWTKAELSEYLTANGIEYGPKAKNAELAELVIQHKEANEV